ncbi:DUF3899 domain-containing protein [Paenibacillus terreus]|uniref:DUF3899 domain-containing protein n=1 Tax=Paenibacillus terreus TaxID=1387834 RepID=A0ABV5BCY0_9BACL
MLLRTIAVTGLAAGITWFICNGSVQAAVVGVGAVSVLQGGQEAANRLFLYGMLALVIGALAYVRNTGFFAPLSKGLTLLQGVSRTSRSLQRENERLMQDEELQSWKLSLYRGLSWYSASIGGGLVLASTVWLLQTAN